MLVPLHRCVRRHLLAEVSWATRYCTSSRHSGSEEGEPSGDAADKRWPAEGAGSKLGDQKSFEHLVSQRIGLTAVHAHVRSGKVEWDTNCDSEETSGKPQNGSKYGLHRLTSWCCKTYRYYRGHAVAQFSATFLPVGYPDTVKDNYVRYSAMAALANFLVSTNTILSSTFLLYAVGLGAGAMPVAGALSWVIKDGIGQAGTLMLGRVVSHDFDLNTRSWHFLSNLVVNVACLVEILTVYQPEYFLFMASVANSLKGVSLMAGGSTRAAFNISFAQGENIADITAKSTSQWICTSLLGTCLGIVIAGSVGQDANSAIVIGGFITLCTAAVTYATVRAVPLANLNSPRMQLLIEEYIARNGAGQAARTVALPNPCQLCAVDPIVLMPAMSTASLFHPGIEVNTPLSELLHPALDDASLKLMRLLDAHRDVRHLLLRDGRQRFSKLHIILHRDATPQDSIMAMLHASLFRRDIKRLGHEVIELQEELQLLRSTLAEAREHRAALIQSLRDAAWNMERVCIEGHVARATWGAAHCPASIKQ